MDKNLEMILENIEEMKQEQLKDMSVATGRDNHQEDSNFEREQ